MFSRRDIMLGVGATLVASPAILKVPQARAQNAVGADTAAGVQSLEARAAQLGVPIPAQPFSEGEDQNDFSALKDRLLNILDAAQPLSEDDNVETLSDDTSNTLIQLHQSEKRDPRGWFKVRRGFRFSNKLAADYSKLFTECVIRPERRLAVARTIRRLSSNPRRAAYEEIQQKTDVPWYVVAVLHSLEASSNLKAHLHNGDSLSARTVQVPRGRPNPWNPPADWVSSAIDALNWDGMSAPMDRNTDGSLTKMDWSIERTLHRLESFNGLGSRNRGVNTPYLWSFSNQYERGKYVRDHVWNPSAVSQQCGAAVLLKGMVEAGIMPALPHAKKL